MFRDLEDQLNLLKPEHWLNGIRKASQLEQKADKSAEDCTAQVWHLTNRLSTVPVANGMTLFAILGMDHSKYGGLLSRFTSGSSDPAIITASLSQLEAKMTNTDTRKEAMRITPSPIQSAARC